MGIKGWRKLCKERAEWKKITEKAKTHTKEEEDFYLKHIPSI